MFFQLQKAASFAAFLQLDLCQVSKWKESAFLEATDRRQLFQAPPELLLLSGAETVGQRDHHQLDLCRLSSVTCKKDHNALQATIQRYMWIHVDSCIIHLCHLCLSLSLSLFIIQPFLYSLT